MANLIENELSHCYEMARQMEAQLNSAPIEELRSIVQELIVCLEKTKSMAKLGMGEADSPESSIKDSKQPFKVEKKGMISKKRKSQPEWTSQMKLGTGPEAHGPLDDGHGWRKYGQKEILGAKNPRGYYRCTHRNAQGCPAQRRVQQSDDNPLIFEVTYHGTHTCLPKSSFPNHDRKNNKQLLAGSTFQTNLKVDTENLDSKFQDPTSSFSFPPTPIDNCFESSFNASFISPTSLESNYFSASPCGMSSYGGPVIIQASESGFSEIMSSISHKFDDFWMEFESDHSNFII